MLQVRTLSLAAFSLVAAAAGRGQIADPVPQPIEFGTVSVEVADWLQLPATGSNPRARLSVMRPAYDGSGRIWINDLRGPMYVIRDGAASVYLNVASTFGQAFKATPGLGTGFHSFVFHPEFGANGKFYTAHCEQPGSGVPDFGQLIPQAAVLQGVIIEWTATNPASDVFAGTRREIMRVDIPGTKHGFQDIGFHPYAGPGDADYGLLFLCLGDAAAIEEGHPEWGHRLDLPLGTILRIDPSGNNSVNGRYGIPADNPFATDGDPGTLAEIYAWGFRNPHRISWDPAPPHAMFLGDIGERNLEEINIVVAGGDYGYSAREGTFRLDPNGNTDVVYPLPPDDSSFDYIYPVAQYDHDEGRSVAGGFVYRGQAISQLQGLYLFGDIVEGRVFHVDASTLAPGSPAPVSELRLKRNGSPVSLLALVGQSRADLRFGVDEDGELYLTTKGDGKIRRLIADPPVTVVPGRMVNISTRGRVVAGGEVLIGGFVIDEGKRTILIRGVGPSLESFGVTGTLADPLIHVYRSEESAPFATNDDWGSEGDAEAIAAAAASIGAFELPTGSMDAALLLELEAGAYTVHVLGKSAAGIALVEVYELP